MNQQDSPIETWSADRYEVQDLGLVDRSKRVAWVEGCAFCARYYPGQMFPPHDPSPRCESGKHLHCTCDTCF